MPVGTPRGRAGKAIVAPEVATSAAERRVTTKDAKRGQVAPLPTIFGSAAGTESPGDYGTFPVAGETGSYGANRVVLTPTRVSSYPETDKDG